MEYTWDILGISWHISTRQLIGKMMMMMMMMMMMAWLLFFGKSHRSSGDMYNVYIDGDMYVICRVYIYHIYIYISYIYIIYIYIYHIWSLYLMLYLEVHTSCSPYVKGVVQSLVPRSPHWCTTDRLLVSLQSGMDLLLSVICNYPIRIKNIMVDNKWKLYGW